MPRPRRLSLLPGLIGGLAAGLFIWSMSALAAPGQTHLLKRDDFIAPVIHRQFTLPTEVIAILLLIGGDIVQQTIAQLTGAIWFTPVVFSFGWVTYAFSAVASAVGDGSYLPQPDSPGIIVTTNSGDYRQINSWMLSRLMRDLELEIESTTEHEDELNTGLLVTVWQAHPGGRLFRSWGPAWGPLRPKLDLVWWSFLIPLAIQLAIAIWRGVVFGNWAIMFVVAYGNVLAWLTAILPATSGEKFAGRPDSRLTYALTRGNGHKHVFLILPSYGIEKSNLPRLEEIATATVHGGTTSRFLSVGYAALWGFFLLFVAGIDQDTGWVLLVGFVGMAHNIIVAGVPRAPAAHGIPLARYQVNGRPVEFGRNRQGRERVQEILVQLEREFPGAGLSLRPLFYRGFLDERDFSAWKHVPPPPPPAIPPAPAVPNPPPPPPTRVDLASLRNRLDAATAAKLLAENGTIPNANQDITNRLTELGRLMHRMRAPNYETEVFDDNLWDALGLQAANLSNRRDHFKESNLSALHSTFGLI